MAACPELPQKLAIDGREVSLSKHLMSRFSTVCQLFGRMMRTSQTLDKYVYEAILRIRGWLASFTLLFDLLAFSAFP